MQTWLSARMHQQITLHITCLLLYYMVVDPVMGSSVPLTGLVFNPAGCLVTVLTRQAYWRSQISCRLPDHEASCTGTGGTNSTRYMECPITQAPKHSLAVKVLYENWTLPGSCESGDETTQAKTNESGYTYCACRINHRRHVIHT